MSFRKIFIIASLVLFSSIAFVGVFKEKIPFPFVTKAEDERKEEVSREVAHPIEEAPQKEETISRDKVSELFTPLSPLSIVKTVTYTSRVSWLKGRPAWIGDYAKHYETSKHFIARSLNGKRDYTPPSISSGQQFNVLKKEVSFYLLIDLSKCSMSFYAIDMERGNKIFLKEYRVGLGTLDPHLSSGSLTPVGCYLLGDRVGIYRPGKKGHFQNRDVEMIQVFGTRWMPLLAEDGHTPQIEGYGIHGAPWVYDETGSLKELDSVIGRYTSDGCVRLLKEDIEELFAIVITKPTVVEIVKEGQEASLYNK